MLPHGGGAFAGSVVGGGVPAPHGAALGASDDPIPRRGSDSVWFPSFHSQSRGVSMTGDWAYLSFSYVSPEWYL